MTEHSSRDEQARPLARTTARELTREEIDVIAGGRPPPNHTHATGPNGDDPADTGV